MRCAQCVRELLDKRDEFVHVVDILSHNEVLELIHTVCIINVHDNTNKIFIIIKPTRIQTHLVNGYTLSDI